MGIKYKKATHKGNVKQSETSEIFFKSLLLRNLLKA